MRPSDQLTVLEAFALGYAMAGKEQQAKIFAALPASEWLGPLGDAARQLRDAAPLGQLARLGLITVSLSTPMKAIIDELIVAETDKRRMQHGEQLKAIAEKMIDPKRPAIPGDVPATLELIAAKARGFDVCQDRKMAGEVEAAKAKAAQSHP